MGCSKIIKSEFAFIEHDFTASILFKHKQSQAKIDYVWSHSEFNPTYNSIVHTTSQLECNVLTSEHTQSNLCPSMAEASFNAN